MNKIRVIAIMLLIGFFFLQLQNVSAELIENIPEKETIVNGVQEVKNNTDFLVIDFNSIEKKNATMNIAGMSTYLIFTSLDEKFDESKVIYNSRNPEVAYGWNGRILATGKGTTDISLMYEDKEIIVSVNVKNNMTQELRDSIVKKTKQGLGLRTMESIDRSGIVDKASEMCSLYWRPTSDLTGWRGQYIFRANQSYQGIPYSQTYYQVDDIGFRSALNNT